jgi:hypothetical protein
MKTVAVTEATPELRKLVDEVFNGEEVVIAFGEKRVKLERYEPPGSSVDFDIEENSPELEQELLKAVRSTFSPYNRQNLEDIAKKVPGGEAA